MSRLSRQIYIQSDNITYLESIYDLKVKKNVLTSFFFQEFEI